MTERVAATGRRRVGSEQDLTAPATPAHPLHDLQRAAGNAAVNRVLRAATDQVPPHVREAERVASEVVQRAAKAPAAPDPDALREQLGQAFGADFSAVKVPAGSPETLAKAIQAAAAVTGNQVFFGAGPGTDTAAHEAAHVVQQ